MNYSSSYTTLQMNHHPIIQTHLPFSLSTNQDGLQENIQNMQNFKKQQTIMKGFSIVRQ